MKTCTNHTNASVYTPVRDSSIDRQMVAGEYRPTNSPNRAPDDEEQDYQDEEHSGRGL